MRFAETEHPTRFETWCEAERGRFVLWLPVAMAGGVVAYFQGLTEPWPWLGASVFTVFSILLMLARRWRVPAAAGALLAAGALGFASAQFATGRAAPLIEVPTHATIVTGTIRAVERLPAGRRVVLDNPRFDASEVQPRAVRIRLKPADTAELATGDHLRVRALLTRPQPPAYPGGWDLQRDAFFAGMGAFGSALNPSERVGDAHPTSGHGWLQRLREIIAARVSATLAGSPGAIATTLLTGTTTAIPEPDRAAFRDSGLAHLLAIAGLHIGIVMGLVFGATRATLALSERAALFWPSKAIAAGLALAVGGMYLLLTGAHVPIIRSFAMASLVTLGILVGRRAISLRALALAMTAIVLIAPNEVVGVSFQMSFSVVLALIVGYAALRPWLSKLQGDGGKTRRLASHIVALALTSALAGTFSAPYGAYHFGHVQVYFILANMVAVPITAMLVMPAGLVALALMPLHLEALALIPMGWGIEAILWIARAVQSLPAATLPVPHMPPWGLAVFSLGLAWLGIWRTRLRLAGIMAMAAGLASPAFETLPDILVSADARLIAYRSQSGMLVQKTNGGSAFTQESWQQYWSTPPPQILACATPNCLLQPRPQDVAAVLVRGEADASLCGSALLLSAEPIRLRCAGRVPQIDRFTVWHNGAHAIWLGPDRATIVSDRMIRGERPWVIGLRLAGRIPAGTVPALTEPLPPE